MRTGRFPSKPNWNKAKESRKGDLEVVETTLMTSGSTFFMDNETKEKYELQDDLDKIYNVVRMVILKNLETGEIYNFIMVFIGTYDYLMHTTSFENNSYLHREADFDGIRPSALKDLTVVAEGLVALYHCSALAMVNSLLLSKITSSVTLEDHSSCQHE